MRNLLLLGCLGIQVSRALGHRPPQYSLPPNCDLHLVESIEEITANYSSLLTDVERCILFKIEDTGTFLTRKAKRWWGLEAPVESLAKITSMSHFAAAPGFLRPSFFKKSSSSRDDPQWMEFYYENFENRTTKGLTPVSLCHSEVSGEGSVVSLQTIFLTSFGMVGGLTADFDFHNFAISTAAEVTLERAKAVAVKIRCAIKHGEVGQLFLADTSYLYYTPWYRVRNYDSKSNRFSEGTEFIEQPRERRIMKGGVGDWICATSSLADLKCHGLTGLNTFWGANEDLEKEDWTKNNH